MYCELSLNSDYVLPNNVKSIEDFKTSLNESFNDELAGYAYALKKLIGE
jgi:hypothetical protein